MGQKVGYTIPLWPSNPPVEAILLECLILHCLLQTSACSTVALFLFQNNSLNIKELFTLGLWYYIVSYNITLSNL